MMMMSILSPYQKKILSLVAEEKMITDSFYLSGGTGLAEFYLNHRLSEDLDFFSESEVDVLALSTVFKKIQKKAGIIKVRFEQSFNRNLFFLECENDTVKTEFTYFPFPHIESGMMTGHLRVDSLLDIAVNKLFTIYQKPRSRDFIDLYCILQKEKEWDIADLVKKARIKFDYTIDSLQLSSQFVKADVLKDYPKMIRPLDEKLWQSFFLQEARTLAESALA